MVVDKDPNVWVLKRVATVLVFLACVSFLPFLVGHQITLHNYNKCMELTNLTGQDMYYAVKPNACFVRINGNLYLPEAFIKSKNGE
jgi:hypothetical protein